MKHRINCYQSKIGRIKECVTYLISLLCKKEHIVYYREVLHRSILIKMSGTQQKIECELFVNIQDFLFH